MKTANFIYRPAQLGHRELSMTQRYAHLSPDHMKRIASLTLRRPGAKVLETARGRDWALWPFLTDSVLLWGVSPPELQ